MKKILLFLITACSSCFFRAQVTLMNDTIPVIVHVIHLNEAVGTGTNLDSVQIYSQLKVLNADFNGVGYDVQNVPAVWTSLVAQTGIYFVPALYDPQGNTLAEPGIERIPYTSVPGLGSPGSGWTQSTIDAVIKPQTIWDPKLYCNMWVLKLGGGPLAYASLPDSSGLPWLPVNTPGSDSLTDGIVAHYQHFGDTLNVLAPFHKGRSVTHEAGHWLGLIHMTGAGCGTQYVADLPTGDYSTCYGCPAWPLAAGVCSGYPDGPMFNNFMSYVDDSCMNMFSHQQGDTMLYVLHHAQYKNQLQNSWVYHTTVSTAIKNTLSEDALLVYPNPSVGGVFSIKHPGLELQRAEVTDLLGRKAAFEFNAAQNSLKILSAPGVYTVRLKTQKGAVMKKVIVEEN